MRTIYKLFKKENIPFFIAVTFVIIFLAMESGILKTKNHNTRINLSQQNIQEKAASVYTSCSNLDYQGRHNCYESQLKELTGTYGMATGEAILYSLQDKDDFAKSCHVLAHRMAHEAYENTPDDFYNLIDTLNVNACGSGFLHGVLEAYTGDHPEISIDGKFANEICGRGNDDYRQRMCIHFVGHVLLVNTYGDLQEALPLCGMVQDKWKFDCYDGLYMEDHQKLTLSEHDIAPLPKMDKANFVSMESECFRQEGLIGRACWTEMAEMYAHAYGYNPDIIFKGCSKAQNSEFAMSCYLKGVVAMATYLNFDTPKALTSLCSYYEKNPSAYNSCTYNIISALIYYSPKYASRGITLCSSIKDDYVPSCFAYLNERLTSLVPSRNEREQLCANMPETYRARCIN